MPNMLPEKAAKAKNSGPKQGLRDKVRIMENMVPPIGFEPTTPALRIMHKCSKYSAFIT